MVESLYPAEMADLSVEEFMTAVTDLDAGIGFGIYRHDTEADDLSSDVEYNVLMTYIGYSFY